jgi:hypothetical protein
VNQFSSFNTGVSIPRLITLFILINCVAKLPSSMALLAASRDLKVTVDNESPLRDQSGNILDAHDGSLEYLDGRFYLYGTHYGASNGWGKENYFVCYSSRDLTHWQFEGKLLPEAPPRTYFRPHVMFNRRERKYVLWYNADNEYGVAVSAHPQGPFQIVNPNVRLKYSETGVGDFGVFVDRAAAAYIVYTAYVSSAMEAKPVSEPTHHRISVERLSSDYLSSTMQNSGNIAGNVEAPVLFSCRGTYYLLCDNTCAFCQPGSGVRVYISNAPLGPYTYQTNINVDSLQNDIGRSWTPPGTGRANAIIHAQQMGVAELPTSSGKLYVWIGDRWGSAPDGIKGHDLQVWVPLRFQGKTILPLHNDPQWTFTLKLPIGRTEN